MRFGGSRVTVKERADLKLRPMQLTEEQCNQLKSNAVN